MEKENIGNRKSIKSKIVMRNIRKERPISSVYPEIDTDLARDNIENDLTSADFQDL